LPIRYSIRYSRNIRTLQVTNRNAIYRYEHVNPRSFDSSRRCSQWESFPCLCATSTVNCIGHSEARWQTVCIEYTCGT
jgi:hypothetical protein